MNAVHVLVHNGYADWEAASALAELRRTFGFPVRVIGLTNEPIHSMGGLRVTPDLPLAQFTPESAAMLILPGGDFWTEREIPEVSNALRTMVQLKRPVAGICAATLALAHCGLLDARRHTSNGRNFIPQYVDNFRGADLYRALPAVTDQLVITANGLAPVAFAGQIFRMLAPGREAEIGDYEKLHARGLLD